MEGCSVGVDILWLLLFVVVIFPTNYDPNFLLFTQLL